MTDRYAVIGDPVAHSLSPAMQSAALRASGLDATYEAVHVTGDDLPGVVARFRAEEYRGFNVTVPHKEAILPLVDRLDGVAESVGAVNTVVRLGDELVGYNTDVDGFVAAVAPSIGRAGSVPPSPTGGTGEAAPDGGARGPGGGGPAILFGAGGSARAVAQALLYLGYHLTIVNRTLGNARRLAETLPTLPHVLSPDDPALPDLIRGATLLVNTTPLGMAHLSTLSPIPDHIPLNPRSLTVDLVYGRATPFLARAAAAGCRTMDGLEMLVQQGAASFRLWTDLEPDVDLMRAACRQALADRSGAEGTIDDWRERCSAS